MLKRHQEPRDEAASKPSQIGEPPSHPKIPEVWEPDPDLLRSVMEQHPLLTREEATLAILEAGG